MKLLDQIVGDPSEVEVWIDGQRVKVLLDTGSMISTVSLQYCTSRGFELHPLDGLLTVESASGHTLPYLGFVEVSLRCPVQDGVSCALMLVVPNTPYHEKIPVLLGTNVLNRIKPTHLAGQVWEQVFATMAGQRVIDEKDVLGSVYLTNPLTLPPNGRVIVEGQMSFNPNCQRFSVMLDGSDQACLPKGVLITPCVTALSAQNPGQVAIELINHSAQTVIVPRKARLCEVYTVAQICSMDNKGSKIQADSSDFLKHFQHLDANLEPDQVEEVKQKLVNWSHVFSQHDLDLGLTDKAVHKIRLKDERPFKQKARNIPPSLYDEVREHLKEMQELGVIRESKSPYASNVVLVRKKNGTLRFCLDLRHLNSLTVRDSYRLPSIDRTIDTLAGSRWFSVLDLKSGYWQVPLAEEDKAKTAFTVGPLGFWECERMPFGLTNAPATFQRLMETSMGDLYLKYCLLYLDDIVIFSKTYEDHIQRLEAVFQKLHQAGLKLSPSKRRFFPEGDQVPWPYDFRSWCIC